MGSLCPVAEAHELEVARDRMSFVCPLTDCAEKPRACRRGGGRGVPCRGASGCVVVAV